VYSSAQGTTLTFTVANAAGATNYTSFIGIATSAISNGASGQITTLGGINSQVTSLTAGISYFVSTSGSLTTTNTGVKAGTAIANNKISVEYNSRTTVASANGASTIVARDAAGNFSANVVTATSFSGSGANLTALNATEVTSGTLVVANGGTGLTTLTANSVILGNGTSSPTFVAPSSNGNVLTSNGTTWVSSTPTPGLTTGKAIAMAMIFGF
jgi:hypothetical protein